MAIYINVVKLKRSKKMATLKKSKNPNDAFTSYYCSECRMRQKVLQGYCDFCGESFSNYEEVQLAEYETEKNEQHYSISKHDTV